MPFPEADCVVECVGWTLVDIIVDIGADTDEDA